MNSLDHPQTWLHIRISAICQSYVEATGCAKAQAERILTDPASLKLTVQINVPEYHSAAFEQS